MPATAVGDDALVDLWRSLTTTIADVGQRLSRALADAGVEPTWFPVLHVLLRAPGHRLPMSTIARKTSMTSGGFTKLADRLAKDGLIDRRGGDSDRRVVHAKLTAKGMRVAQRGAAAYAEALRTHVAGAVPAADLAALDAVTKALHVSDPRDEDDSPPEAVTARGERMNRTVRAPGRRSTD